MRRLFLFALIALVLAACKTTSYRSYDASADEVAPLSQDVRFDVADGFYRDSPDCAVVLAAPAGVPANLANIVERAVARNLREKIRHVIDPAARQRAEFELALDLDDPQDAKRFAAIKKCRHFLRIHQAAVEDTYAVLWSERRLTLELALHRARDNAVVWRVAHTASRGDGGLPLSPLGLGSAVLRAGLSSSDVEAVPSLVDDMMRRMFATLPDVRW